MKRHTFLNLLATATLSLSVTQAADVLTSGFLKREFWSNQTDKTPLEDGSLGAPTNVTAVATFEAPLNVADNYVQRISGFFTPATTDDYVFFLASDDDSDLFLSTDDTPANKHLIAKEASWSNSRQYVAVGGGASTIEDKRSDSFTASEWPGGTTIHLTAGTRYYIEADHHEGGGGDDLSVYIKKASEDDPVNGAAPSTAGGTFSFFAAPATVSFTTQPQSTTVTEGKSATLTVAATTTSAYGISGYQWKKNGVAIPGATSSSYTIPVQALSDTGAKYTVDVLAAGAGAVSSAQATITVVADTTPPVLVSAGSLKNFTGANEIGLLFDENLNGSTTTALSNYTIDGGATITGARYVTNSSGLNSFQQGVILTVSNLTPGNTYHVTAKGVADVKNNAIATAQSATFVASNFNWISIGDTVNGVKNEAIAVGTNGFNVVNGGNAFWNTTDDITMVYESISGDFDKKAQVEWSDPSSNWARAGISAREDLNNGQATTDASGANPASRYQMVISDPMTKFDGTAANDAYETNRRRNTGGATDSASGGGTVTYPNSWVRLKRVGQIISMFYSSDGNTWRSLGGTDFGDDTVSDTPLPASLFVGPTVGVENGNITGQGGTTNQQGAFAARFRNYGDVSQKARGTQAYSIGLNFGANEGGSTLSGNDVAGVDKVAQAHWNNLFGNTTSGAPATNTIVAEKGSTTVNTPVTVEFDSPNTWASQGPRGEQNNPMTGNDQILLTGYLDTGGATTTQVKIGSIPTDLTSAGYDVVVYALGGVGARGGAYRITDSTGAVLADYVRAQGPNNPTNLVRAVPDGTNYAVGNYIVFTNIKSSSIIVEATTDNSLGFSGTPRAPINAIQLVSPSGLAGGGGGGGGTNAPPTLSISGSGANISVTFQGTLQASDVVTGPYTPVAGATSPYPVTNSGKARFFRAVR